MKLYTSRARVSAQFPDLPGQRKEFFRAKDIQLRGSFHRRFSVSYDAKKASCERRRGGARSQSNNTHCGSRAPHQTSGALVSPWKQKPERD